MKTPIEIKFTDEDQVLCGKMGDKPCLVLTETATSGEPQQVCITFDTVDKVRTLAGELNLLVAEWKP